MMKSNARQRGLTSAIALVSAVGLSSTAIAQETAALEEVIVTAQKRAESIRDVPLAISAYSGEMLQQANVVQLYDLQRLAPSLRVDTGARADKPRIMIRGIGSSGGTAIEPSAATFVDGVYIPREGATLANYLDIEAVEVLRGPQGTLFGRNASVGAISLRTADPRDETAGSLTAEVGTGDRYKLNGYANIAASDKVAFRFAGLTEVFDGLYENDLTGDRVGGIDTFAGRGSVRVELSDNLEDVFRLGVSRREGNDIFTPYSLLSDSFPPGTLSTYLARFAAIGSNNVDLDPFDSHINQFVDDVLDEDQVSASNELSFTGPNGSVIKLISGFNRWDSEQRGHHVFSAETPTAIQLQHTRSKSHQQELQFISPADFLTRGLSAVGGLYYFEEDLLIDEDFQLAVDGCTLALPTNPLYASCVANAGSPATDVDFDQTTESLAAYAQLTYAFTERLDLTVGTRWTRDEKDALLVARPLHPIGALLTGTETTPLGVESSKATYRANLAWRPTDAAMIFASFTTGFKSGGFNSAASNVALNQTRVLRPETVESYELGAKTSWFDDVLRLDLVTYQMEIEDFQDRSFTGVSFAVNNAGGIRNRGAELDFSVRPTRGSRLAAGVAYLDSEFTAYPGASRPPGLPGTQDLAGTRPTFTPEWTGTITGELNGTLGKSGMSWSLRSDVAFTTETNVGGVNDNNPDTIQDGYTLLSARASISSGRWTASLFGSNLTNEDYCTSLAYQPFAALVGAQVPGHAALRCNVVATPRTFGAALSVDF
jgi:iron complex outermembrane recepter protein